MQVVAVAAVVGAATALTGPSAVADRSRHTVFTMQPSELDESSSLVVSAIHPRLVYTANDSGGSATVYVLDSRTGELVGQTELAGVVAVDVEAMAAGSDGSLVVADIGDNDSDRSATVAYRIDQPTRGTHVVTPEAVQLTLSTGAHDAEAALYDAASGRLFVVTKQVAGAQVYRSPTDVFNRSRAVLKPIRGAPRISTDATFIRDGSIAVIRTYWAAYFYSFPSWRELAYAELPRERQGEALAAPDDDHLWIGSEGEHSDVLSVRVPELDTPEPSGASTAPPTTSPQVDAETQEEHREQLKTGALVVGGAALALFAVVAGFVAFRYHRHPHEH